MHLISIIVPVYNVEKYIVECIESVIKQTYTEWELLLIDDGSTDCSGKICNDFALTDSRIKVFHKKNGGQPSALNYGLDCAQGKYVIFMDSDDYWCDDDILNKLYQKAELFNLDIVRGECKEVDNTGTTIYNYLRENDKLKYSNQVVDATFFIDKLVAGRYFMVLYLIKRSTIGKLRYNENRVFLQDAEFNLSLCGMQNLRCMYIPEVFYAYRKHDNAITVKDHPQKFFDALNYTRFCFDLATQKSDRKEYCLFLVNEGVKNYLFDIQVISKTDRTNKEYNEVIRKYDLYNRRLEVIKNAHDYPISIRYYLCFLPLKILIYYYRIFYDVKRNVSYIYHKKLRK